MSMTKYPKNHQKLKIWKISPLPFSVNRERVVSKMQIKCEHNRINDVITRFPDYMHIYNRPSKKRHWRNYCRELMGTNRVKSQEPSVLLLVPMIYIYADVLL